jgi:hypothetical protein
MSDSDNFALGFDPLKQMAFSLSGNLMIEPPALKVYLASPLTNNDPETDKDCRLVREITKRVFGNYEYLGIRFDLYDPAEVTPPGSEHTSEEVNLTDHNRTATADLVIFHVNCPSLGVGMEAQIAAGATVPRVVVSKKNAKISRMFLGACSPTLATIQYENSIEFESQLFGLLPQIAAKATDSAARRRQFVAELRESAMGRKIFKQRILGKIKIDDLARAADIGEPFLRRLERDPEWAANVTQIQLGRILASTNCSASITPSGMTKLTVSDSALPSAQKQSLDNLVDFVTSQRDWLPDNTIFRVWQDYIDENKEEMAEAIRHRSEPTDNVITVDVWRERYANLGLF